MPIEEVLVATKNKISSQIKTEMIKNGYTTTSLANLLNISRPAASYAINGGTTPRDIVNRKKIYKVLDMEEVTK